MHDESTPIQRSHCCSNDVYSLFTEAIRDKDIEKMTLDISFGRGDTAGANCTPNDAFHAICQPSGS